MKVEGNDRAFAAWEDLRRRVEALENSIPLNSRVDPPGCPACDGVAGTTCRCAEPVPEWRQMVDDYAREDPGESRAVLGYVLGLLADITSGENWQKPHSELAQIIAHCEGQVGGGWQADPEVELVGSVWVLLSMFTDQDPRLLVPEQPERAHWMNLGNYAAAWLKELCNADS